ncbi:MAG TPA: exo-alpha-sialidase [Intrasporangium sp.]|nr:exo-alpha-sialidase [Intrasporangium sp.]
MAAAALAGCGAQDGAVPAAAGAPSSAAARSALPSGHVHGIGRDPADGTLYLATHEGLFRRASSAWQRVGPVIDLMGFAVAGPGRFLASGHPGIGVDLPQPVGLIESRDGGQSWTVRSRGGASDFHTLTSWAKGVIGFDGRLRSTSDGASWRELSLDAEPRSVASSPDGAAVLATTAEGLRLSTDHGASWRTAGSSPLLLLVAWADARTAVGVTPEGQVALSTDAAKSWTSGAATVADAPHALTATRRPDGTLEILVVSSAGIEQSLDSGASFTLLPAS